ncbi:hypothetical protein [Corynebacterium kalidii]
MTTIRVERAEDGAPVWLQIPWHLQREALYLFAIFTLTLAMIQPSGMRWWAVGLAATLLLVHAVVGPDDRNERCGL